MKYLRFNIYELVSFVESKTGITFTGQDIKDYSDYSGIRVKKPNGSFFEARGRHFEKGLKEFRQDNTGGAREALKETGVIK